MKNKLKSKIRKALNSKVKEVSKNILFNHAKDSKYGKVISFDNLLDALDKNFNLHFNEDEKKILGECFTKF